MKRASILFIFLFVGVTFQTSCGGSNPSTPGTGPTRTSTSTRTITLTPTITLTRTQTSTPTVTNTPLPIGVVFSVNGTAYSITGPSGSVVTSATIDVGEYAVWDSSNSGSHTLYISSAGTGTCFQNTSTFPVTYNLSAGTYQFHCSIHSSCGTASCNNCNSMAATLIVQTP